MEDEAAVDVGFAEMEDIWGLERALGGAMAHSMTERLDFDLWWLVYSWDGKQRKCTFCKRIYNSQGWLRRHLLRSGHWKDMWESVWEELRRQVE